jgi:ABC-type transport system involved in multi-copper enzyme maturation permease subunit
MPIFLRWLLRLGPLNPIAVRLVQGGSRRKRHLYVRAIYLGALIVTLLYLLIIRAGPGDLDYRKLASAAAESFQLVAYLQIALICILAPVFMAGAIAQEANPRTWDIMLTTPLSAGEIVLGNLFGRLFFILALLFSSLPLFALTQYFGGVPGRSIFASYAIAGSAATFVGALAIALSVSRLVGKRAVFTFYIAVVSYIAVTIAIDSIRGGSRVSYLTALNPFLTLKALLDPSGYPRSPAGSEVGLGAWFLEKPVTTFCLISIGLSALLMALSTITVRAGGIRGLGGVGGREGAAGGPAPWYRRIFGLGARGAEHRAPRAVWQNPIAWREAAARNATFGRMLARWLFIALGGLFALGIVLAHHLGHIDTSTFRSIILYTVLAELAVLTLVSVNMSATAVAKEREDGTLDLLLTTPITPRSYLEGKLRGMVAYLLPLIAVPVGTLLLAGGYVGLGLLNFARNANGFTMPYAPPATGTPITLQIPAILPEAGIVAAIVAVPFIAVCCLAGLSFSLKSKGTIGSVVATVGAVGVVAGIIGLCASQAGPQIQFLGPVFAALSPGSAVFAGVIPEGGLRSTIDSSGLASARIGLFVGALISAGICFGIIYGLVANMVATFDATVRRLAGVG